MSDWRRPLAAAFLVCATWGSALADTAAGVAAYDKGDYETARNLFAVEAEKNDAVAEVYLGQMLARGEGGARDPARAVQLFKRSADQGNLEAMYSLGVAYDIGDAGTTDHAKAMEWYRKAAERGHAKAQFNLGQMLQSGDGVPADYAESIKWLQKAADQNEADAEASLGVAYVKGLGVESNLLAARYWAERAALHGSEYGRGFAAALRKDFARMEFEYQVPRTTGGDGATEETAIVLPDVENEEDGVRAEHFIARYFFRSWSWGGQALRRGANDHPYDLITLSKDGASREIYFDISNWFGKLD